MRSLGVALDVVAGTVRNTDIEPAGVTARMQIAREDIAVIPGYETGWETDLRGALQLKRDQMILNGQAAVANTSPAVAGILRTIADPANPGDVATYANYLNAFDDVDAYSDDGSNDFALLRDRAEMGPGRDKR